MTLVAQSSRPAPAVRYLDRDVTTGINNPLEKEPIAWAEGIRFMGSDSSHQLKETTQA